MIMKIVLYYTHQMPNVNSYPGLGERGLWAKHTLNLQTPMRLVYKFIQLSASTVILQVEINQMNQKTLRLTLEWLQHLQTP